MLLWNLGNTAHFHKVRTSESMININNDSPSYVLHFACYLQFLFSKKPRLLARPERVMKVVKAVSCQSQRDKQIKMTTISLSFWVMIRRTENSHVFRTLISPGDGVWEQTDSKSSEWGWTRMMIAHSVVPSPGVTWDDRTSTWLRLAGLHTLLANTSKSFRNPSKKKSSKAKER